MKDDIQLLEGSWVLVSLVHDGKEVPPQMYANARLEIHGHRFTSVGMGAEYGGKLEVAELASPKQLDFIFDTGPEAGNVNYAIYTLRANVLTLCISTKDPERPLVFKSDVGSGDALEVFVRSS